MIAIFAFCAVAAVVGLLGGATLRKQSFFWCGGLILGGVAALAYAGAMGGSALAFKVYYALGASMFPGWVGVGSLQIVFNRRVVRLPAIFVIMLSALQLGLTLPADVNPGALAHLAGGNGAGVLVPGGWVLPTVLFNTFGLGFAAVAAFFAWWRAFRRQAAANAAAAIGLSIVVIGILCRSDAIYRLLVDTGAGAGFLLADATAFALVWAGARVTRELPRPLRRLLLPDVPSTTGVRLPLT